MFCNWGFLVFNFLLGFFIFVITFQRLRGFRLVGCCGFEFYGVFLIHIVIILLLICMMMVMMMMVLMFIRVHAHGSVSGCWQ